jgi:hypothetical protein
MGNVSIDGKLLWLSGRYDDVVYVVDTTTEQSSKSVSPRNRMASRCGPSPAATRWATPGTCAREGR